MTSKPTLLLIGGSFTPASAYDDLASRLRSAGYEIHVPQLLSIGKKTPVPTLEDDVKVVRGVLADLVDKQGKDVLLIAHSYGGVPSTQSIEGYSRAARKAKGEEGGVVRILYTAAVVPKVGEGAMHGVKGPLPDYLVIEDESWGRLIPEGAAKGSFDEESYEIGLKWAKAAQEHALGTLAAPLAYAGYNDVPVSYLVFEKDKVISPEGQLSMIERMQSEGVEVDVHKLPVVHAAHMSDPEEVLKVIVEVAGKDL